MEKGPPENTREARQRIISIDNAAAPQGAEKSGESDEKPHNGSEAAPEPEGGELDRHEIANIVEALLFAAGAPLSSVRINEIVGLGGPQKAADAVMIVREKFESENRPYFIQELAGGYQIRTKPEMEPWVNKLHRQQHQDTLSRAALETLSIVAYRQPLTRAGIEDIRGVQSGYILRSLIEKSMVRVTGRSEELGRPLLYGTTKKFLETFGLASLKDLPALDDPDTPAARR